MPDGLLDPELSDALLPMPDILFSADTLPAMRAGAAFPPGADPDVERHELAAGPDGNIRLSLLRPRAAAGRLPAIYWMHGGGLVIGNRHMDDDQLARWCRTFSCACVSVEYRLAPETPYPGPLDDCDTGLRYVLDHAGRLGIDPGSIGAGGRSAGAGLAAALALRDRDRGENLLAFQYLCYPMLDDRQQTPSSRLPGLPMFSRESNAFCWQSYLAGRQGTPGLPADAAPARARDLSGLPPAFVSVGTADGFRDEAIDYATRLIAAGVPTELHVYTGAVHGFEMFSGTAVARCAVQDADNWVGRQLARRSSPTAPGAGRTVT
jgi:acetyl esterase/lipase